MKLFYTKIKEYELHHGNTILLRPQKCYHIPYVEILAQLYIFYDFLKLIKQGNPNSKKKSYIHYLALQTFVLSVKHKNIAVYHFDPMLES